MGSPGRGAPRRPINQGPECGSPAGEGPELSVPSYYLRDSGKEGAREPGCLASGHTMKLGVRDSIPKSNQQL